MIKHIPNALTLLNLFCGCLAIAFAFDNEWNAFIVCVFLSLVADLLDGFLARKLGVASPLGVQLDSLADAVSFGVSPGVLMYLLLNGADGPGKPWSFLAFIIPVASVWRLAKFNLDTRQTKGFIGLPTPANSLFIIGYFWLAEVESRIPWLKEPWVISLIIGLSAWAMVSSMPLVKFKTLSFAAVEGRLAWFLLAVSAPSFIFLGIGGLAIPVLLYILLSLLLNSAQAQKPIG
jgi:CDP-diacylglycerol---serine O-phosphatidyltransferase